MEFGNNYYGRGRVTQYVYDAFGRRVAKINPHKTALTDAHVIFYGWDGDKLVTTQYNQEKIYTLYAPNSFVPLLRFTQPLDADTQTFPYTIHTYYCDHRGAPTALISKEGKIEWQAEYDVWGNILSESNPQKLYQPIRLQGQHYDLESGLYYNRHRYYDPQVGRYITQDPIGLRGGSNLYQYPLNPNQQIDPMGLIIEYANHEIAYSGNFHSKIVITPNNQAAYQNNPLFTNTNADGMRFATLGAGPSGKIPFWGVNNLESGINRVRDVSEPMMNRVEIDIGNCNEDDVINKLIELSNNYNNNQVEYFIFPSDAQQHNSNSFIAGLSRAAGLDVPVVTGIGVSIPGYEFPVPTDNFLNGLGNQ